ncbi:MAG TPA: MazG-like family protein [Candidatus Eisenbacteria bacterium]|nr:MazG-like family protein [Candidatus Eisenbacteria bacterium]
MNVKNLQERLKELAAHSQISYKLRTPQEQEILSRTVKLNEEVGELCNDILSILKLQRKAKLENFDKRNVYQEFADVIMTTIQLANAANVDIERAIEDKIKKVEEKYEKRT